MEDFVLAALAAAALCLPAALLWRRERGKGRGCGGRCAGCGSRTLCPRSREREKRDEQEKNND